jgi:ubiquinone/menaquinone biosynthesis C-methylase UbiE
MPTESHDAIVRDQFGPQARSYLTSTVHAAGEDLDEMSRRVGQRGNEVALDVGCGAGHAAFRLAPLVERVVAYDLSEAMLGMVAEEATRRGLTNLVTGYGAVEKLPYPPGSFDVAVTRYSAHHWSDARAGLAQMRRVVRTGGLAVVMDVVAPGAPLLDTWLQALELLRDPSHVRNYSLAEWHDMLTSAGFVLGDSKEYRLRLDFASWVGRMRTAEDHVRAIRSLQRRAGAEVSRHFAFEDDGSFTIDTMLIVAEAS